MQGKKPITEVYNQGINLFWTALCFAPVLWFWLHHGRGTWFYIFLGISLGVALWPGRFLQYLQASQRARFYERLGVRTIRRFVQDGDWRRRQGAGWEGRLIRDMASAKRYLRTIAMYERYHWSCFFFFGFTGLYALCLGHVMPAAKVLLANILYNLCSIALQQYNRIRIRRVLAYKE